MDCDETLIFLYPQKSIISLLSLKFSFCYKTCCAIFLKFKVFKFCNYREENVVYLGLYYPAFYLLL